MRYYNPATGAITLTMSNKRVIRFPGQKWSEDVPLELEGSPELTAARNQKKLVREKRPAAAPAKESVAVIAPEVTPPVVMSPQEEPKPRIFSEVSGLVLPNHFNNNDDNDRES